MTPQAVIDYLRNAGQEAMAATVKQLRDDATRFQQSALATLKDYYELKDKYEPRPKSPSCWKNNWTGD